MLASIPPIPSDEATLLISLLIHLVFGGICAAIAVGRGRSGVGWFFLGVLFNCFALVIVLVIPDLKQEELRLLRQEQENRRLREQIAKERQVSDQRHAGVERRLGAHDQALGLDTAAATAIGNGDAPELLPPPLPSNVAMAWYYARDNQRLGPVAAEVLRQMIQNGEVFADTLVWRQGMDQWQALGTVAEWKGMVG